VTALSSSLRVKRLVKSNVSKYVVLDIGVACVTLTFALYYFIVCWFVQVLCLQCFTFCFYTFMPGCICNVFRSALLIMQTVIAVYLQVDAKMR